MVLVFFFSLLHFQESKNCTITLLYLFIYYIYYMYLSIVYDLPIIFIYLFSVTCLVPSESAVEL